MLYFLNVSVSAYLPNPHPFLNVLWGNVTTVYNISTTLFECDQIAVTVCVIKTRTFQVIHQIRIHILWLHFFSHVSYHQGIFLRRCNICW